jgi:cation diffusion facilitator CzcD-associated flavoprotein CzcO
MMEERLRLDTNPGNKDFTNAAVVIIGAGISGTRLLDRVLRELC